MQKLHLDMHMLKVARIALFICMLWILVTGCGGTSPSPQQPASQLQPSPTISTTGHPGFQGIYQFKGEDDPANASNPYLAGANITFYWSQLEPAPGQYDWGAVDAAMQPWIAHGKKLILRISTSGWTSWNPPYSAHGTPQWVYDGGVPFVTETDDSIFPQYWHPFFLQSLRNFVSALAQRYDGNPHLAYIQIGVGVGGETKVDTHGKSNPYLLSLWQSIGYTDAIWWDTIQKIIAIYTDNFHTTPLALMPDATFIGSTRSYKESLLLSYARQHGIWLQDNGFVARRNLPSVWQAGTHIVEQVASTQKTGDSLQSELQAALALGASYFLVFTSDINNPTNQEALRQAANVTASSTA